MTAARVEVQSQVPGPTQGDPASTAHEAQYRDRVFRLALMIDSDIELVRQWYCDETIEELGRLTPRELCQTGSGGLLVAFLQEVRHGQRG